MTYIATLVFPLIALACGIAVARSLLGYVALIRAELREPPAK